MTWVVASPTAFGYAIGLSDVQVTWGKGENAIRHDCLQKVYEVAPFIAAGFSGPVRLGFQVLQDLAQFLLSPMPQPGESWMPRWVAFKWYRRVRRIYNHSPPAEQGLGLSVMLIGVRPWDCSGCITGGRPDVIELSATRRFQPECIPLGDVASIGCGNNIQLYQDELKAITSNPLPLMQAEVGCPAGFGRAVTSSLARVLRGNPERGISQNVHRIVVWRDRVEIGPLELTKMAADGATTQYKMPPVANGWTEFRRFAEKAGVSAAEACA
jgi:hypothetical protein